jgi:hypothetical protein
MLTSWVLFHTSWVLNFHGSFILMDISVSLTQQSLAESFIDSLGIPSTGLSTYTTPY